MNKRDPELRKRAWRQFTAEFDAHKFTVASTLASSIKSDVAGARARNYSSAREGALFYDDVPVSVYDNLIAAVRANLAPLYRYLELRRRDLGLKEIHAYDTKVPIVPNIDTDVSWDQACDKVLAALAPLGEEYVQTLSVGLRGRWCVRYENKGKRSGNLQFVELRQSALYPDELQARRLLRRPTRSRTKPAIPCTPWNSQRTQPFQTYDYPIFLAEVASTFNEELLTHYLLEHTEDKSMRAYRYQPPDRRHPRHQSFARRCLPSSKRSRTPARKPANRSPSRPSAASTAELLDAYFGPGFVIATANSSWECLRIPHFYSAFYVCTPPARRAAVALAGQVLQTGDATRYLGFLKSGGSEFPIPTLQKAGVDMSSPAPVEATLQLFARRVEELETLLQ